MNQKIAYIVDSVFEPGPVSYLKHLVQSQALEAFELEVILLDHCTTAEQMDYFGGRVKFHVLPRTRSFIGQVAVLRKLIQRIAPGVVHGWGLETRSKTQAACFNLETKQITTAFELPTDPTSLIGGALNRAGSDIVVANHKTIAAALVDYGCQCGSTIPLCASAPAINRAAAKTALLEKCGIDKSSVYVAATVTGYQPKYRLKDLVWAVDLLCQVREDFHLVVFGRGCDRAIMNYVSKLECDGHVHFVPEQEARMEWIAGTDMYWNCQPHQPSPPAMLFAMQQSIPVISLLADTTADLVLPLRSALAANYGARDEFARWTKYLIELPEAAQKIGHQGKQHVENMFANDCSLDAYSKLYRQLLQS